MERRFAILALLAAALAPACRSADPHASDGRRIFRLGYLPNVTHATALWGLESGAFGSALGPSVVLEARAFNAGPSVIEALFAGDLDAAWVPEPWSSRLVLEHKGVVLVDERELWPARSFPTSVLIASSAAIARRRDLVQKIVDANSEAVRALAGGKGARDLVATRLTRELGKK